MRRLTDREAEHIRESLSDVSDDSFEPSHRLSPLELELDNMLVARGLLFIYYAEHNGECLEFSKATYLGRIALRAYDITRPGVYRVA